MKIFSMTTALAAAALILSFFVPSTVSEENDLSFKSTDRHDNLWVKNFQSLDSAHRLKGSLQQPLHNMVQMRKPNNAQTFSQRQSALMCSSSPNITLLTTGNSVTFRSPNYPKKYPNNEACGWVLGSNDPNVRIKITCSKFRLQKAKNNNCPDFLNLNNNIYCGRKKPSQWISTTNQVSILFQSNNKMRYKGFCCKATAIDASSVDSTKCLGLPIVNTLPAGASMTLTSPRYPKKYPRNELCGWYIQGQDWSVRVNITCDDFKLQNPNGNRCPDSLTLATNSYCGSSGPSEWISGTSQTSVFFSSNNKKQRTGFSCTATAVCPSAYGIGATTNCKCGRANRATRIVGGHPTEVNEYPWQVSLVVRDTNETMCGGSIINNRWILTAAHCTAASSNFQVVVGAHAWSNPTASFQRLEYETFVYYPYYDSNTEDNDLVLVKLVDTLDFSDPAVAPICPPDPNEDYIGINATVSGWGILSNGTSFQPDELQEVDVITVNHTDCVAAYSPDYVITNNMLCAGHPLGGKDSCQGDSGGPLFTQEGDHYVQIAVVSFGVGCGDPAYPGVYAKIANYDKLTWINSVASGAETCPK